MGIMIWKMVWLCLIILDVIGLLYLLIGMDGYGVALTVQSAMHGEEKLAVQLL